MLTEIRRGLPVSNDPELVQYIQALGTRIISGGLESNFPFTFLLVENPSINAFAMPGGIIAINSGLFTLTTRESELASVIAHEIAHVTQRHIARNLENAKSFNVVSALTFLGAILASIYNVDLGQAALMTSQAGLQQATLAYSRAFEQEADRIGMHLMVSAGIDPYGMPQFFKRMHKYTQLNHGKLPEFLRTHPLTLQRISESEARARQYRGAYAFNSIDYDYARARALALSEPPTELIEHYRVKGRTPGQARAGVAPPGGNHRKHRKPAYRETGQCPDSPGHGTNRHGYTRIPGQDLSWKFAGHLLPGNEPDQGRPGAAGPGKA